VLPTPSARRDVTHHVTADVIVRFCFGDPLDDSMMMRFRCEWGEVGEVLVVAVWGGGEEGVGVGGGRLLLLLSSLTRLARAGRVARVFRLQLHTERVYNLKNINRRDAQFI
jgi:hypothetical protein